MRGAWALLRRDMLLLARNPGEWLVPLAFFLMVTAVFPLALGPAPQSLRAAAPGIIWTAALLSSLLVQHALFRADHEDGTLEQILISGQPMILLILAKTAAHWLASGAPLTLLAPLSAVWLQLSGDELMRLLITLPLGTGVFSLLSAFAAALLAGARNSHFLAALLCAPLCMPTVIFAAAAVRGETAPLLLLAALFMLAVTVLPLAAAGALRLGTER